MTHIHITANIELDPWTDLQAGPPLLNAGEIERIGILPQGMQSGRASIAIIGRLPDGTPVVMETSLAMFRLAAAALLATPTAQFELAEADGRDPT